MSVFPTKPQSFSLGQEFLLSYKKRADVFPVTNKHYAQKMLVIMFVVQSYMRVRKGHFVTSTFNNTFPCANCPGKNV